MTGAFRGIGAALPAHCRGAGRGALGSCRPAGARPPLLPLDGAGPASRAERFEALDPASGGIFEGKERRAFGP